jgi:peroxiredoxin
MKDWCAGLGGLLAGAGLIGNSLAESKAVVPATPEAAAEWAKSLPAMARSQALHGVMAGWAESEPEAAYKWAKNLGEQDEWIAGNVIGVWSRKDPVSASRFALEMPEGPQKIRAMEQIGQAWGGKNRGEAMAWAEKIKADADRKAAVGGVVQSWAMQDPAAALQFAEGQSDAKLKEQYVGKVIYGWCFKDRPGAEKWVQELPEGDFKKSMKEAFDQAPVIRRRVGGVCGTAGEEKVKVGQEAPLFSTKTVDGKELKLADYRGKFVLLDFWATWCGPCLGETPNLKAVFEKYGKRQDFALIGLSLDGDPAKPAAYAKENGCGWVDGFLGDWGKDEVTKLYGVRGIPSIWLIGPDGKVVASGLRGDGIMAAVSGVLEAKP